MRSPLRATMAFLAAAVLLPVTALTATAAVDNDTPEAAIPTELGTIYTQDTREAVTEPEDAGLSVNCLGVPAVKGSVWYSYTSDGSEGAGIIVDGTVTAEDGTITSYDLGFMIYEGTPTADSLVACGPMMSGAYTTAGNTYYIMAFTANSTDVPGGDLVLQVRAGGETPTMSVTVDKRGTSFKDGSARITGTYSCTDAEYSELWGTLTQRVGRLKITGEFYVTDLTCDGGTYPWDAFATSQNGYFAGGKAANVTIGFVCGALECAEGWAEATVQLTRASKK